MRVKHISFVLVTIFTSSFSFAQTNLIKYSLNTSNIGSAKNAFDSTLFLIQERTNQLKNPSGKIGFGMNGNTGEKNKLFKLNSSIEVTKFYFPYELNFASQYQVVSNGGKLQEDVSKFEVSYDHYLNELSKPVNFEGFAFADRQSNLQMSVEQRYEVGGGIIAQHWSTSDRYSKKSKDQNLLNMKFQKDSIDEIVFWQDSTKINSPQRVSLGQKSAAFIEEVVLAQKAILQTSIKENTRLRYGLLTGIFYEIEKINFADSFVTSGGTKYLDAGFKSTNRLRWEIRPTIDLAISDHINIKLRSYFKFPMPGERWNALVDGEEVFDLRIETPLSLSMTLNKNFDLSLSYTNFFDLAPNSVLSNEVAVDGSPIYITANQKNEIINFTVTLKI
jgi:hypothetical protein